jgi:hypothetical protein
VRAPVLVGGMVPVLALVALRATLDHLHEQQRAAVNEDGHEHLTSTRDPHWHEHGS